MVVSVENCARVLRDVLGENSTTELEDMGMWEYLTESVADTLSESDSPEDIATVLEPILCQTSAFADEEETMRLASRIYDELRNVGEPEKDAAFEAPGDSFVPIQVAMASLDMGDGILRDEAKGGRGASGNANSTFNPREVSRRAGEREEESIREARQEQPNANDEFKIERGLAGAGSVEAIKLEHIHVAFRGSNLIDDASLTLVRDRRYGLVGRNGRGKSTFLRAFAAREIQGVPKGTQILLIEQEARASDDSVLDAVLSTDVERSELLARCDKAHGDELKRIFDRLTEIDADGAPARASAILHGLGFSEEMQKRATREFSGGWRMRLAIARALFVAPEVLLLDEPTNHLDVQASFWLAHRLQQMSGIVLVVSHDRGFLNAVCSDIIHLHGGDLVMYRGNYAAFEKQKAERDLRQARAKERQDALRGHIQSFVDRFRFKAKRAALVQSRIKRLEKMPLIPDVVEDPEVRLAIPSASTARSTPMKLEDATFRFPGSDQTIFSKISLSVDPDSRMAFVGPNGAGKTTLLRVLRGELEPVGGLSLRSAQCRVAAFDQHVVETLPKRSTALEHLLTICPGDGSQSQREKMLSHLSSFGITAETAMRSLETLSGGQKSRVALASCCAIPPHVLILDEPTNHLDIDTIDALIVALASFDGAVVLVSHDLEFVEAVADELWVVENGRVERYPSSVEDFRKNLIESITKANSRQSR